MCARPSRIFRCFIFLAHIVNAKIYKHIIEKSNFRGNHFTDRYSDGRTYWVSASVFLYRKRIHYRFKLGGQFS